jgi:outer membrane murein-binding lipoprotein Lpp
VETFPAAPNLLQAAAATSGRDRKAAQRKAAQAKDRLQKYEQRIAEAEAEKKQVGRC